MLNKKITTKRSTLLILSMCCTVPSIRTITNTEIAGMVHLATQPATALIICRQLSLLHMTMPAIVSTFIGIFVFSVIICRCFMRLEIENTLKLSLIVLSITIIVCALFALIAYLTTFDLTRVLLIINVISLIWLIDGDIEELVIPALLFIALLLVIIVFNYIGFYIGQLIW